MLNCFVLKFILQNVVRKIIKICLKSSCIDVQPLIPHIPIPRYLPKSSLHSHCPTDSLLKINCTNVHCLPSYSGPVGWCGPVLTMTEAHLQ